MPCTRTRQSTKSQHAFFATFYYACALVQPAVVCEVLSAVPCVSRTTSLTCSSVLSSSTQGCLSSTLEPRGPGPSSTTGTHTTLAHAGTTPPPPAAAAPPASTPAAVAALTACATAAAAAGYPAASPAAPGGCCQSPCCPSEEVCLCLDAAGVLCVLTVAGVVSVARVLSVAGVLCVLRTSFSRVCLAWKLGRTATGWLTSSRASEPSSDTTDRMLPAPAGLWGGGGGTGGRGGQEDCRC
jgi:hypothetical protein